MLDYRITTFLTLYREMNYRKTAELLNMTQPGVTHHIHFLENHYNIKLFEYNGRALQKTKNAEILKRHIDSMMTEEHAMRQEFLERNSVVLNVGATKTIGEFVLVDTVRKFLSDKHHNINLVVDNTENLLQMLENAELDFAVVEGVFDKTRYCYHLFKKENFSGICAKDHRFARKKVSIDDIFEETLIVREQGSGTRRLLEQAISDRGFSLDSFCRVISVSNFSVITDMIAKDNAISFAYEPIAINKPSLATFEVEDMQIKGEFNFVYCNTSIAREKIKMLFGQTQNSQSLRT